MEQEIHNESEALQVLHKMQQCGPQMVVMTSTNLGEQGKLTGYASLKTGNFIPVGNREQTFALMSFQINAEQY